MNLIPQRFKYRSGSTWHTGCCLPLSGHWRIYTSDGATTCFEDDPWDAFSEVSQAIDELIWLDTDYGWAGK